MFQNPFTPSFGGKPDFFFGREQILERFGRALVNRGSDERSLFITGNRGCGKTALLEQLSIRAHDASWLTIDVNSEQALGTITRRLVRHRIETKGIAPEIGVSVLGSGATVKGPSSSKSTSFEKDDIELIFLEACEQHPEGIFISIDEIQKIDINELSLLCGAFQMATRKGHNIILAVAGLPYSYEEIIQAKGCTYMRRSAHIRLSVFTHDETRTAFAQAFAHVPGLSLSEDALEILIEASFGHPFFVQLAGYCLVEYLNTTISEATYLVTPKDVKAILPQTISLFEERSVAPVVRALPKSERTYLQAMADVIGPDRIARTSAIAEALKKAPSQISGARKGLIDKGVVVAVAYGKLMFNMPYLSDHLNRHALANPEPALALEWRF